MEWIIFGPIAMSILFAITEQRRRTRRIASRFASYII